MKMIPASKSFISECKEEFGDDYEMFSSYCGSLSGTDKDGSTIGIEPCSEATYLQA